MSKTKLILIDEEFYLIGTEMAKNIDEFFMERSLNGKWDIYSLDTINDSIHGGFKILATTALLSGVPKIDKAGLSNLIASAIHETYTSKDIQDAMEFMAKFYRFCHLFANNGPIDAMKTYLKSLENEWACEVEEIDGPTFISGGLVPTGEIGGKGLQAHPTKLIKIKTIL